jgi:peptide chain release factor subunit 1
MGAVEHLLISEDLRRWRVTFTHRQTKAEQIKTVDQHKLDTAFDAMSREWGGNNVEMNKQDLIEELSDLAEASGTEVHLVSAASEEGGILRNAFGGIAAILRYRF